MGRMATDYDSPRKTDEDITEDSLQELQARRMDKSSSTRTVSPREARRRTRFEPRKPAPPVTRIVRLT